MALSLPASVVYAGTLPSGQSYCPHHFLLPPMPSSPYFFNNVWAYGEPWWLILLCTLFQWLGCVVALPVFLKSRQTEKNHALLLPCLFDSRHTHENFEAGSYEYAPNTRV